MSERRRGTSLATQVTVAGVGFGLLVAVVFGLLVHAVREQRDATRRTTAAADVVATGNRLERLVIDSETAMRGFVISGDPRFLAPLDGAKTQIPEDFARLRALAAGDVATTGRLAALQGAVAAYLRDWIDRVVAVARGDRPRARRLVSAGEGKRRVDAIRARFDALLGDRRLAASAQAVRASDRARTATALGVAGVVGSVLVFAVFATYVVRAILAPVRRTAGTAGRIARGDFDVRVKGADHAQAELGSMVRGFNAMADALQDGHDELESGRARLERQNRELEAQRRELESVVRQLEDEKRRIAEAQAFGEAVAAEARFAPLADLILARVADAIGADVGAIFARDARRDDALAPAVTRGLRREDLPARLEPGVGFAGRAAAERRTVAADFSESEMQVHAYGLPVTVRHELHVPLVQSGQVFGVLSLARLAGDAWTQAEQELASHLADQAATALAKAVALRESRSRLGLTRAVLDATPDAIGLFGADRRLAVANEPLRAAVAQLGEAGVVTAPAGPEPSRDELALPDGRVLARYVARLDQEADGVDGTLVVLRDVTAEREAERLKDEFFALVSHELRTPLTSVIGYLELLREEEAAADDGGAAERAHYVAVIDRNARRLLRLVGDLLFVAQIEAGRLSLEAGAADLAAIARQSLEAARPRAAQAGVELEDRIEEVGAVPGDADRLGQAIDNLVSNALKFTPAGGRVTVRLAAERDAAVLDVADTGMGIAAEDQERLFERFFRAGAATAAAIQGVGLGLTIVRAIVEGHGGSVEVRSRAGEGATFRVRLPLRRPAPGPVRRAARSAVAGAPPAAHGGAR